MFLKEMKTLFKLSLFILVPFFVNGQINTFQTGTNKLFLESFSTTVTSSVFDNSSHIRAEPRLFGVRSVSNNQTSSSYLLGVSFSGNISNKITYMSTYDYLAGNHNFLIREYQDSLAVFPDFDLENTRWQLHAKYKFNKFVTADFGKGKHFIGDGYRSILLSSSHSAYPYLKLSTEFGRVKYYNLYTTFLDIQNSYQQRKKHASIHFLDFQLTRNMNVGIFEGVLWQAKDEYYNKGYDIAYLNPIIFYRPVEFSKRSPDNVVMGANFNAKFDKIILYGQVLLDDLNIARRKDGDKNYRGGFFQNKFAYQLGVKSSFKAISALVEYNQVQPYTYAHKETMQSYTHMNQALAHPLGANFKEVVVLAQYKTEKWTLNVKLTAARIGLDSVNTHYGQNIFASDFEAQGDGQQYSYGNFNGQGVLTQINAVYTEVAYSLKWYDIFGSIYYKKKTSDLLRQNSLWYSLGLRTFPFSAFQDY